MCDCGGRPAGCEHHCTPSRIADEIHQRAESRRGGYGREAGWDNGSGPAAHFVADRHAGRRYDLAALVAGADAEPPWRVRGFAADGHLTTLAAAGGEGKTWLLMALAGAVAQGSTLAGLRCEPGRAVIFDAENGSWVLGSRLSSIDPGLPAERVAIYDADGLRLSDPADRASMLGVVREVRADLFVVDSLRALAPDVGENYSDEVAPVMVGVRQLARESGAAGVLLHHRGNDPARDFRGSTTIRDQTDLLFVLEREAKDPERKWRRRLRCTKCRIAEEPDDRWLGIRSWHAQVTLTEADPYEPGGGGVKPATKTAQALDQALAHLRADGPSTGAQVSLALTGQKNNGTVRNALKLGAERGELEHVDGRWQAVRGLQPNLATPLQPLLPRGLRRPRPL